MPVVVNMCSVWQECPSRRRSQSSKIGLQAVCRGDLWSLNWRRSAVLSFDSPYWLVAWKSLNNRKSRPNGRGTVSFRLVEVFEVSGKQKKEEGPFKYLPLAGREKRTVFSRLPLRLSLLALP